MRDGLQIVVCGLSITSSWGNGHATTYRALLRELAARGHNVTFLERDVPWYRDNRDLSSPPFCKVYLYETVRELKETHLSLIRKADLVIVGSYVPEGVEVGDWAIENGRGLKAFYDIDTPVTLSKIARGDHEYLAPRLIPKYDLYLSFTGGPVLSRIETELGSPCAEALYCSVDPELYFPETSELEWNLGYLGTYSVDRQPVLETLLLQPARKNNDMQFVVAGPQYPTSIEWPSNVERIEHLPPSRHRQFYNSQAFTLNVTRADMTAAGYSPSVRLFEAAACGTPIISDSWPGLGTFFHIGEEILVATDGTACERILRSTDECTRSTIAQKARARVLAEHTAHHRAKQLEEYIGRARDRKAELRLRSRICISQATY
jgi:spore maturation protein CgeB